VQHWSAVGSPAGITDPLGYRWDEEADSLGRSVARISPLGQRLDVGYDPMGRPIEVTTSTGATTAVARDVLGRPTQLTLDGSPAARYTYTPAGRVRAVLAPDGSTWRFEYDRVGRLVMIEQPDGGHDLFEYDASSRLVAYTTAEGRRSEFTWGPDGRPAALRQGQQLTRYLRDGVGRITELHLPDGSAQRFVYDARGDVVEVVDPLGGRTRLRRDQLGNVVSLIDAKEARWEWNYDEAGRLIGATDPIGRHTQLQLDPTGRLDSLVVNDDVSQHFSWDADGQLQSVATERRPLVLVERDATGRQVRVLHGTSDGAAVVTDLAFDQRGRMVTHQIGDRRTSWQYDDDRRTTTVVPPTGEPVVVTVDADGRPTAVEQGRMGVVEFDYDLDGRLTQLRSAGLHRRWQRDDQGRVTQYREDLAVGGSRQTELVRDDAGRVVEEHRDDGRWFYRYDGAGQLIGADRPDGNWEWRYDEVGRLIEELSPAGSRRFGYDDADQLRRVDGPTGETVLEYDGSGRRIAERRPTETVRYRWDETGRLEAIERESASGLERIDMQVDVIGWLSGAAGMALEWSPGGPLGELPVSIGDRQVVVLPGLPIATTSSGPDGSVDWLSTDWRGTVGDHTGPWAEPEPGQGPRLGYLGEVQVGGLVWLRNRLYDPATHAFLSPDPIGGLAGYPGGLSNPYGYANNDPLGWLDPLGLRPLTIDEANAQMQSWKHGHWQELAVATVAIVGTVAICVATGGLAAPIMAGIGFAAAGGGTILNAKLTHQEIDWGNVLMNASMGGLLGAGAAAITPAAAVAVRVGVGGAYGTTTGAASSVVTQAFGTGEFNLHTIDPKAVAVDAAFGGVEGLIPPVRNADMNIAGLPQVPKSTELVYNSVIQGHYQPLAQSGAAIGKANLPGAMPSGPPAPPGPVNAQQLSQQLDQYR
jgi:RHS repeat-associated protein